MCDAYLVCLPLGGHVPASPGYSCFGASGGFYRDGISYYNHFYDLVSENGCGCKDEDGGLNYFDKGMVYVEKVDVTVLGRGMPSRGGGNCRSQSECEYFGEDACVNSTHLKEYYCDSHGVGNYTIRCPAGCSNGACICPDTDGGENYYVRGSVAGMRDYCLDSTMLREYTCDIDSNGNIIAKGKDVACPYGCNALNGVCVCRDSDGGINYEERGRIGTYEDYCSDSRTLVEYYNEEIKIFVSETHRPGIEYVDPIEIKYLQYQALKVPYYSWDITLPAEGSKEIVYHIKPQNIGMITFSPAVVNDEYGNVFESNPTNIKITCNPNGKCDPGENYLFCPEDCTTGIADGICDGVKDGRIDPDCAEGVDPDYAAAPVSTPTPKPIPSFLPIALAVVVILAVITVFALLFMRRKKED